MGKKSCGYAGRVHPSNRRVFPFLVTLGRIWVTMVTMVTMLLLGMRQFTPSILPKTTHC